MIAKANEITDMVLSILPKIAIDLDTIEETPLSAALAAMDAAVTRSRQFSLASRLVSDLDYLASEVDGAARNRVQRMAKAGRTRMMTAVESTKINVVHAAAHGNRQAILFFMREPVLSVLRGRCRSWFRKRNKGQRDIARVDQSADRFIESILKRSAAAAIKNRTSAKDVVGIMVGHAIREFRGHRGPRELLTRELQESDRQKVEGGDGVLSTVRPTTFHGKDYFSIANAARAVKTSIQTIYRWIKDGKVHAPKLGERYYIDMAGLDRLLKIQRQMDQRIRRRDADDGMFSVSDIIGGITRSNDERDGRLYDAWRHKVIRAARALNIPNRRDRRGDRRFTQAEKDRIKRLLADRHSSHPY